MGTVPRFMMLDKDLLPKSEFPLDTSTIKGQLLAPKKWVQAFKEIVPRLNEIEKNTQKHIHDLDDEETREMKEMKAAGEFPDIKGNNHLEMPTQDAMLSSQVIQIAASAKETWTKSCLDLKNTAVKCKVSLGFADVDPTKLDCQAGPEQNRETSEMLKSAANVEYME